MLKITQGVERALNSRDMECSHCRMRAACSRSIPLSIEAETRMEVWMQSVDGLLDADLIGVL